MVTGQDRGIVTAVSYSAKALGITRGLPIFRVKRDYPNVIILPGDYPSYVHYSGLMFDIVRRYADDVEEYSIDECFADITGLDKPLKMTYREIAERIKKEINEELDLSISVGVAPTKSLAKVASKWVKPNGLTVIEKETAHNFLERTPIEKIWGIGNQTSIFLKKRGIKTAVDFACKKREWVEENLSKPYKAIWYELNAIPIMEVDPLPKLLYSSIQKTQTFRPPSNDKIFLLSQLSGHIEDACAKARRYDLVPKSISFFLKTQDFRYVSRSLHLACATNAPEAIIHLAHIELEKMHVKDVLYRTAGVGLHGLVPGKAYQGDLFGGTAKAGKFEEIHKRMDVLEKKWGRKMVWVGSSGSDGNDKMSEMKGDKLFL